MTAGGPAERAGIKRGDVLTAVNNQPVIDSNSLRNQVASIKPGATATLTVARNGRDQNLQVALAELPDRRRPDTDDDESSSNGTTPGVNNSKFGLRLQPLTADTASRYGLDSGDQGLLVSQVDPSGSAASAGIRQGDLIQEVNRQPVRTFAEFSSAIQQSGAGPALVLVKRRDAIVYLTLRANS